MADGRLLGRRGDSELRGDLVMAPCPCCGTPTPAPERRDPVGTQYTDDETSRRPALVLWNCPGAREIDLDLLCRFGVIVKRSHTCNTTRGTWWNEATEDLRRRSLEADHLRLAMDGWI